VIPGTEGHGRACVAFHGQEVWARQLNPERGEPMALNDGGPLWVLGYKTEDCGVSFQTVNGGSSEVMGGNLFSGRPHSTAFVIDESEARVNGATSGGVPEGYHGTGLRETRDGETRTWAHDAFPTRGVPEKNGPQYHIPLYTSLPLQD